MNEFITTRRQQFFYLLKTRFLDLIFISIYTAIFLLPLIVYMIFVNGITYQSNIFNHLLIHLPYVALFMIMSLGVSGGLYVIKRMVFSQGASPHQDFFIGIKKNYKMFIKIYAIVGVIYVLFRLNQIVIFENNSYSENVKIILLGISYVFLFIMLITFTFVQIQAIIYQGSIRQFFLNGLKFTFGKIVNNLLIFVICYLPFLFFEFSLFIENISLISVMQWGSFIISLIIYFGISFLLFTTYSYTIFDKTINLHYNELINKGLQKEEYKTYGDDL